MRPSHQKAGFTLRRELRHVGIKVSQAVKAARGHWAKILPALGVNILKNRHQPCPVCGGKDRFRFDDQEGRGTWFCNQCGAGMV